MPISLIHPLSQIPLVFVDTETTGASVDFGHRIIEIGIVRVEGGVRVAEYQQLFDAQRHVSAGVMALTGITAEMLVGRPLFADCVPKMCEIMSGAVVIGHNVRFDLAFLAREFRRGGCNLADRLPQAHVLDTLRIARRRFGAGGNGLQRLAVRLGCPPEVAHRALADARTTHMVLQAMLESCGGWNLMLVDALEAQGGPISFLPNAQHESLLPLELEEALATRRPVKVEYVDSDERRTQRIITPVRLRRSGSELILIAHCQLRDAQRSFKVDRIVRFGEANPSLENATSLPLNRQ